LDSGIFESSISVFSIEEVEVNRELSFTGINILIEKMENE
jgi:hypothetical protein